MKTSFISRPLSIMLAGVIVSLSNLAIASDGELKDHKKSYIVEYPPYVTSLDQKVDFTVQCIVAYKHAATFAQGEEDKDLKEEVKLRASMWEENLETLVSKKKQRKKLIKAEKKPYQSTDIVRLLENAKKILQCDEPGEDLRHIG